MTRRRLALTVLLSLSLLPEAALARPVAKAFDFKVGKEEFVRAWLKAVAVDEPAVASVELLPSQEMLITALKPGRAVLLLVGDSGLEAVRVRVSVEGEHAPEIHATDEQRAAVKKACPGSAEEGKDGERTLSAAVSSNGCRKALKELLATDDYSTRRLELQFTPETLLDQLNELRVTAKARGLEAIQIGYSGVTLTLKGKARGAQKLELMKVLYDGVVGPVLFEDSIETIEEPKKAVEPEPPPAGPDAGPPAKPGPKTIYVH